MLSLVLVIGSVFRLKIRLVIFWLTGKQLNYVCLIHRPYIFSTLGTLLIGFPKPILFSRSITFGNPFFQPMSCRAGQKL